MTVSGYGWLTSLHTTTWSFQSYHYTYICMRIALLADADTDCFLGKNTCHIHTTLFRNVYKISLSEIVWLDAQRFWLTVKKVCQKLGSWTKKGSHHQINGNKSWVITTTIYYRYFWPFTTISFLRFYERSIKKGPKWNILSPFAFQSWWTAILYGIMWYITWKKVKKKFAYYLSFHSLKQPYTM